MAAAIAAPTIPPALSGGGYPSSLSGTTAAAGDGVGVGRRRARNGFPVPIDKLPFTPKDGEGIFHQGRGLQITFKAASGGQKLVFAGSSYVSPRRIILVESVSQRRTPSSDPRRVYSVTLDAVEDERLVDRVLSAPSIKFCVGNTLPECPAGTFKIICNASDRARASNALCKLFFVLLSRLCEARFPPVLLPDEVEAELRAAAARSVGHSAPPGHAEVWPADDAQPGLSRPGSFIGSPAPSPPASFGPCREDVPTVFEPLTPENRGPAARSRRGSLASIASSDANEDEESVSSAHPSAVHPEPTLLPPLVAIRRGRSGSLPGNLPLNLVNLPLNTAGPGSPISPPPERRAPPQPSPPNSSPTDSLSEAGDRVPNLPSFGQQRRGSKPSVFETVLEEIRRPFRPRSSSSPAILDAALRPAAPGSRRVLVPMFDPQTGHLEYVPQSFTPRRAAFADPATGEIFLAEESEFPDTGARRVPACMLPAILQGRGAGPAPEPDSAVPPRQYSEADLRRMVTQMQALCARYK